MEVPAGQDGIQRLLQAEQEAQAIVTKARQGITVCALCRISDFFSFWMVWVLVIVHRDKGMG